MQIILTEEEYKALLNKANPNFEVEVDKAVKEKLKFVREQFANMIREGRWINNPTKLVTQILNLLDNH